MKEDTEMQQWMSELLKCYRELSAESEKKKQEKSSPLAPGTSVRAKNELLLILAASNLPTFSQSEPYREMTIKKTISMDDYKDDHHH